MIPFDEIKLSPNLVKAPVNGSTVIIHATRSGISHYARELEATLNWFSRPGNPSSNFVIDYDGTIVLVVDPAFRAAHAQEDNDNAWGIEVCQGVESDGFTDKQYEALARVCRGFMADYNVPAIHCVSSIMPGFIGHEETAQGKRNGKSDPGRLFDWDRFISSLTEPVQEDIPTMTWARLKNRPESVMFRTYLLWADKDGLKSRFVPNFEEHQALEESQAAGPLLELSIETLRQFGCNPDPLS